MAVRPWRGGEKKGEEDSDKKKKAQPIFFFLNWRIPGDKSEVEIKQKSDFFFSHFAILHKSLGNRVAGVEI